MDTGDGTVEIRNEQDHTVTTWKFEWVPWSEAGPAEAKEMEGMGWQFREALEALGPFKADPLPIATLGRNTPEAQRIVDRAGWK